MVKVETKKTSEKTLTVIEEIEPKIIEEFEPESPLHEEISEK